MISSSCFTRRFFALLAIVVLAVSCFATAFAKSDDKPAILLVAFGSSMPEAQISFETIEAKVRETYPDYDVRWAFTSHIIIEKLHEETGEVLYSPEEALEMMKKEGITKVAVQSLHSIPGEEYEGLLEVVAGVEGMTIHVGLPLLGGQADIDRVADALLANVPAERKAQDAVVFMGHGTHHPANENYQFMQDALAKLDADTFLGTVEGTPTLEDVVAGLAKTDAKNVYLIPFMSVAGDHARNDMAGGEPDSWNTILAGHGYNCIPVLKGTAEYLNIVAVWMDHLAVAVQSFK